MEKFTPIAMRCNQEQFEAIKPKLINNIQEMSGFKVCNYLTNNLGGKEMIVSNIHYTDKERKNRTVYEIWNEETFLRACGIEVDEPLTVSKEFILELHNDVIWPSVKAKIEKEFPQLFEVKLEVGKWYKVVGKNIIFSLYEDGIYGFMNGVEKTMNWDFVYNSVLELADESLVETALVNEAKKRGFKEGVKIKNLFDYNLIICKGEINNFYSNQLWFDKVGCIFKDGKWAEILPQPIKMTVAEVEAKLGYAVEIVK
jgi:hypothetical protein